MVGSRRERGRGAAAALTIACLAVGFPAGAADELSGVDKLRSLYSAEFRFTEAGLPIVPVAVAQGASEVRISGPPGLRMLPEGDDGPELTLDESWVVRAPSTTPARLRFWVIAWRGRSQQGAEAAALAQQWKAKGTEARTFEQGTLFAVSGEVLDRREVLVAVAPAATWEAAEKTQERLRQSKEIGAGGIYTELIERPHGQLEAVGQRSGARVRNEGVLWFAPPASQAQPLALEWRRSAGKGLSEKTGKGTYHGRLYVTIDRKGGLAVVNAVPEDRLLAGLVPAEIFPSAPDEALKAQAVAARNELIVKVGTRHSGEPFRLCAETHCQVYAGASRETPRTTAAVQATRGQVLFASGGKALVDAFYSANCGGHTEHNENAWSDQAPQPTLRGHRDTLSRAADPFSGGVSEALIERFLEHPGPAFCGDSSQQGGSDRFRWTVTRSAADLERLLGPLRLGRLTEISVLERGISGRARAVRLVGSSRTETVKGELRIRQTFGNLRSSMFAVKLEGGAATFRGGGFGHGVGLCQTGSIGMAEAGKSYKEILGHYYQGSVLRKLW